MRLQKMVLENFRRFAHLEIVLDHAPRILLIGDNGSGKTSVLEAVAKGLGWLVARIYRERGMGGSIQDAEILNGRSEAAITLTVEHHGETYEWTLAGTRRGYKRMRGGRWTGVTALADRFRTDLTDDPETVALPLLVYYPVERSVLDIPLRIRERHSFEQVDGYDGALTAGADFRRFFEWYRWREDIENEQIVRTGERENLDPHLDVTRRAICRFMPGFHDLRVQRKPRLRMTVAKGEETLEVGQLSQGEKTLMALVGDIARRLSMMNPTLDDPLAGEGIVLIDEIDLHLHPRWQRTVLGNLVGIFPNCQFILTTHSPQVLGEAEGYATLRFNDRQPLPERVPGTFGWDSNRLLEMVMRTDSSNKKVMAEVDRLFEHVERRQFEAANLLLAKLEEVLLPQAPELVEARALMGKVRWLDAQNR